ncbi:MAG: glycosyltransferase family 4 protein [Planctomycetes bacterium]|nr:glycosyltransferase family 4 protein [Planctomycetota bacterium]
MRSILHLLPNLDYHGHARQASLLGQALSRQHFKIQTFSIAGPGPLAEPLQGAELPVRGHSRRRLFDVDHMLSLRNLLNRDRPDLIHAWNVESLGLLWWSTLLKRSLLPSLIVSLRSSVLRGKSLRLLDRRLLNRVRYFVVPNEFERQVFLTAGLPADRLRVIRPGVPAPIPPSTREEFLGKLGIAPNCHNVFGVGHINTPDRFFDSIAACEMARYVESSLQLILVGDGPARRRVSNSLFSSSKPGLGVHFLGAKSNAADLLCFADVVHVVHHGTGGLFSTLEGMAAGRPVIASDTPHLADLIRHGETGILLPTNNQPALARATLRLLEDEGQRQKLGEAARIVAATEFTLEKMNSSFATLYDEATSVT